MRSKKRAPRKARKGRMLDCEILIDGEGRVFARNLPAELVEALHAIFADDGGMAMRHRKVGQYKRRKGE